MLTVEDYLQQFPLGPDRFQRGLARALELTLDPWLKACDQSIGIAAIGHCEQSPRYSAPKAHALDAVDTCHDQR